MRSVCLSKQDIAITYQPDFHETLWESVACAMEETIQLRSDSESQGGSTNVVLLSLMLRETAFGLGRGLSSPGALLVHSFGITYPLIC